MDNFPFEFTFVFVIAMFFVFAAAITVAVFYLLTLQNALKTIAPQNRQMPPENVWLLLIPLFNLVWSFIVVNRIADSIKAELAMRGTPTDERPTYGIGLAMCILSLCGWIPGVSIAGIICWIIYWVKVNEFKNKFRNEPYSPDKDSQIFGAMNNY